MVQLRIGRLPEGVNLAPSDDIQGLVAQGRTITETIEIARNIAKKLIGSQTGSARMALVPACESFEYPVIVATGWVALQASGIETASFV